MKSRDEILSLLRRYKPTAQEKYGISKLGIFGSVARGEQTPDSDIDVCYEGLAPSFLTLDMIQSELEQLLGSKVDLVRVRDNMNSMLRLDAICMNLIALGEAVKGLDKVTGGQLLKNYPEVYWKGVMGMRDKISHHYFEIDTDVVFRTLEEDIPAMIPVVKKIISDLGHRSASYLCTMTHLLWQNNEHR